MPWFSHLLTEIGVEMAKAISIQEAEEVGVREKKEIWDIDTVMVIKDLEDRRVQGVRESEALAVG